MASILQLRQAEWAFHEIIVAASGVPPATPIFRFAFEFCQKCRKSRIAGISGEDASPLHLHLLK